MQSKKLYSGILTINNHQMGSPRESWWAQQPRLFQWVINLYKKTPILFSYFVSSMFELRNWDSVFLLQTTDGTDLAQILIFTSTEQAHEMGFQRDFNTILGWVPNSSCIMAAIWRIVPFRGYLMEARLAGAAGTDIYPTLQTAPACCGPQWFTLRAVAVTLILWVTQEDGEPPSHTSLFNRLLGTGVWKEQKSRSEHSLNYLGS